MSQALKQLPNNLVLGDLKPEIGAQVRIETHAPRRRYSCKLLGYKEGGSIMISAPVSAGRAIVINEGAPLTARLMSGNYIIAFSTRMLKAHSTPFSYWHLEYPKQLETRRIRQHTRVPVNLLVSVDEVEEGSNHFAEWPCTAFCKDISLTGACIDSPHALGRINDRLFLSLRVNVADMDQVILVPAVIRNINQVEGGPATVFSHGVEYLDLDDETRLVLSGFVYQQFLIETGHLDDLA